MRKPAFCIFLWGLCILISFFYWPLLCGGYQISIAYCLFSSPEPSHLSRRLIGELIGYPWSGRPSVVRPFTMLKDLLRNRLGDESQILCGASLGRGNDILFAASGSHDQDGRHAHIW